MKLAFLLSGQPRFYKETFPSIQEKILSKYDCDVYAHAWWSRDEVNEPQYLPSWSLKNPPFTLDIDFVDTFKTLYNPKNYLIEKSLIRGSHTEPDFDEFLNTLTDKYPTHNVSKYIEHEMAAPLHKLISTHRATELIDWNINYDWIVMWRYDAIPINFPNLYEITEQALHSCSDRLSTFADHTNLPYSHFIDVGWILHPSHKEIFNIIQFFTDFVNGKLYIPIVEERCIRLRSIEAFWALYAHYLNIPVVNHSYEKFGISINRGK